MDALDIYFLVVSAIMGLVVGSFLNCMAVRIVSGEDFVHGRSHCMTCGHSLGALDLIPLFSYIMTKGKCRYCGEHVSIRYPLTEAAFSLMLVILYLRSGFSLVTLRDMILTACLFALSLVDIDSMTIPDGILLAGLIDWAIFAFFVYDGIKEVLIHIAGGAGAGLVMLGISLLMDRFLGRESMGGGDIKLIALLGLFIGPLGVYFLIIIACVIGLIFAAIMKLSGRMAEGGVFPFGPSIALAGYLMLLFAEPLTKWYTGFF